MQPILPPEFHSQLVAMATSMNQIPFLLFDHLRRKHDRILKEKLSDISRPYKQTMTDLAKTKVDRHSIYFCIKWVTLPFLPLADWA